MKVPEEILRVERPANTVVLDRGESKGDYRYIVQYRARKGSSGEKNERNLLLGYIINGKYVEFVPIEFSFSFGGGAFAHDVSKDILTDLRAVFGRKDGLFLYILALTRAVKPTLVPGRIAQFYTNSYIGKTFPDFDMTEAGIKKRLNRIKDENFKHYKERIRSRVPDTAQLLYSGVCISEPAGVSIQTLSYVYTPDKWELISVKKVYDARVCGHNPAADIALAMLQAFPAAENPQRRLFLDMLSLSVILRMMKRARETDVLKKISYFDMVDLLNNCCKDHKTEPENMLADGDWSWLPTDGVSVINDLGFMAPIVKKRRRVPWRKKKDAGSDDIV